VLFRVRIRRIYDTPIPVRFLVGECPCCGELHCARAALTDAAAQAYRVAGVA